MAAFLEAGIDESPDELGAELDAVRSSVRAWAMTHGHEVTDRPCAIWKGGLDKSFTADGSYDVFWAVK